MRNENRREQMDVVVVLPRSIRWSFQDAFRILTNEIILNWKIFHTDEFHLTVDKKSKTNW